MNNIPWNRVKIPENALQTQLERASQCAWSSHEYLCNIRDYLGDRLSENHQKELIKSFYHLDQALETIRNIQFDAGLNIPYEQG